MEKKTFKVKDRYIRQYYQGFDSEESVETRILNLEQYMFGFSGFDPRIGKQREAGAEHSLFFLEQLQGSSVIIEPSIGSKDKLQEQLEDCIDVAQAFVSLFGNLLKRVTFHTDLCKSLRTLREISESSLNRDFFRAVVDIHDCTRGTDPEEMTREMTSAIKHGIDGLSLNIKTEDLFDLNERLFASGLRPWPTQKKASKEENPIIRQP